MKQFVVFAILLLLFLVPASSTSAADCVAPLTSDPTKCPTGHSYPCNVTNEWMVTQLTCCNNATECSNATPPTPIINQQTSPTQSQTEILCEKDTTKVRTAFGCVDATPEGIFKLFFTLGIGIAGGIAFLLIMFGGFQIMTSAGNPEQLNEGKELVSSAIAGLLMVVFSVFLLQVIGVQILCIPGFENC